jgi:hypothetical protein
MATWALPEISNWATWLAVGHLDGALGRGENNDGGKYDIVPERRTGDWPSHNFVSNALIGLLRLHTPRV